MKYYIIAGEASGDLHAANLIKAIKQRNAQAEFRAWGGDMMQQQGAQVVKHYRDLAFMGFLEVVQNLDTILSNIKYCKQDILAYKPDALILVDYPGFNLRIAKWAKQQGIKVIYYISPQLWAWNEGRVEIIKRTVDLMLVILPFEEEFYQKHNYKVHFVGHPLLDAIDSGEWRVAGGEFFKEKKQSKEREKLKTQDSRLKTILLLPGSRKQEISKMLPIMLSVVKHFPEYEFIVAGAPSQPTEFYQNTIGNSKVKVVSGQTYNLLANAHAALVTSGTATLETALFNVPEVVCYKGSWASYQLAKQLIKVKYISLVNLILEKTAVIELIQDELTEENLVKELKNIVAESAARQAMLADFITLKTKLGGAGASARAAGTIIDFMKK